MKFCFSRIIENVERAIEISKPDVGEDVSFHIKNGDLYEKIIKGKSSNYEKKVGKYNYAMIGNERDSFDSLFPKGFECLVRIIGITNALGNYFTFFNNYTISIEGFKTYVNDLKGFVFVDWDVVSGKTSGAQLQYITTDDETNAGEEELKRYYNAGSISMIHYEISDEKRNVYCLDSDFINKGRTAFINGIRNKVHQILLRKFPG